MELFDRNQTNADSSQKALLIYLDIFGQHDNGEEEFLELVRSTGVEITQLIRLKINSIKAAHFIGTGKVEELAKLVKEHQIDMVIFSSELTPSQERNLERTIKSQVLDRVGLILDIFSLRARSFEGKLQVELAQLKHLSTRLVKGWSHLERQKGGIGLRGPGETQLETDRRLVGKRIKTLNEKLEKVSNRREISRKSRSKNDVPMITLAGYTNAGKSTLFNTLTQSTIYADDRLFATLDATIRRVILPASGVAVIADTVGFINDLPTDLISAFKSTLEESTNANVLLHVVDSTDMHHHNKISQVDAILADIGAHEIPSIIVMNKIDALESVMPHIERDNNNEITKVWLSSKTAAGIDLLYSAMAEKLSGLITKETIIIDAVSAHIRSQIYDVGYINTEKMDEFGRWILEISVTKHYLHKLLNTKGVQLWQN